MYKLIIIISLLLIGFGCSSELTFYEILGVSKQASTQEIRQAYKKLAIKLHPDKNSNKTEQDAFLKITEAYETLKDPEKRHKYNLYGSHQAYTRKYDYHSQSEYNNLFMKGLYYDDPYVVTITANSFDNFFTEELHFVNFYSPFCPPCQNLAEHWKKLAEVYAGIVKVGAVNCKYYNSFCYHVKEIHSYPTLYFYTNGRKDTSTQYRGDRTFKSLEEFVLSYLSDIVDVPKWTVVKASRMPTVYVLESSVDKNALLRIAYKLKRVANVCVTNEKVLRSLVKDPNMKAALKYYDNTFDIDTTDEQTLLKSIVRNLPGIEQIGKKQFQELRNRLRNDESENAWVLYFSARARDKLAMYQTVAALPEMRFVEISCDKLSELCSSLQVDKAPAWGIVKPGGAYQRLFSQPSSNLIRICARAYNLHTLSTSDFSKILDGDLSTWVLLVAPFKVQWEQILPAFVEAALELRATGVSFGIMACTLKTDEHCRRVAQNTPVLAVQQRRHLHLFSGDINTQAIVEFFMLIQRFKDLVIDEQTLLEIASDQSRDETWAVGCFPANCGPQCDHFEHQIRLTAKRLSILPYIRVGVLRCGRGRPTSGYCANVRAPTLRVYPHNSVQHYTILLQHLSESLYISEWVVSHGGDYISSLTTDNYFKKTVLDDDVPLSLRKPWVVYFHSPKCSKCYENYPDFAVMAHQLGHVVNFGKVNCITDRPICTEEYIYSYPSVRIYMNKNHQRGYTAVINVQITDYSRLLHELKPHLGDYNDEIYAAMKKLGAIKDQYHDEL
ncbi:dnaJ homolog subfamily C member 10-like [Leptidea sinapis]|uniref:dnaJ homolog subfamily C member 10-like n=1 Tax=Leptidea sinapis TaxID=189913 RepID=UPI002132379E|nr:dnaJ homolog subfamily C member 10-like [Leptidea sinapis]